MQVLCADVRLDSCGTDLRQRGVELEDLALALHLAHTQFTGQLHRRGTEALQSEGAVQVPLRTAPYLLKRQLLHAQPKRFFFMLDFITCFILHSSVQMK